MPISLFQSSLIDELREEKRREEKENKLSIETHQFQIVSIKNSTTNKRNKREQERKKRTKEFCL